MKAQHIIIIAVGLVAATVAGIGAQTLVLETADGSANDVGSHTSLALDASGNPHVSYQDLTTGDLKYSRKSGGVWTIETADGSANDVGSHTSLALDTSGNLHVSYHDATAGDLKYARKSGGAWTIETADGSANVVGFYTSLALDASGNPHVSYKDETVDNLKYARKSGGVWTIETADGSANLVGYFSSLALDASGNPHVTYTDATNGNLKYARKSGGVWTLETADGSANFVGYYTSLALDASGNPHASYLESTAIDLKYARKFGGAWTTETADGSANDRGYSTSLALDASGNPHVSYWDFTDGDLKYARKSGGVWTTETADGSVNNVGSYTSLALDASGNPHVSYYDATIGDLKYAFIPSVLISSPQSGVTWPVGSAQTLRWSYTGGLGTDNTDVFLSLDGGNNYTLISDNARDFELAVRVPHTPTRFARIKLVQPSPFTVGQMDSFFTIDATITLNKFEARVVGDDVARKGAGVSAKGAGSDLAPARAVALTWETTPGREADIRYRVERAATDDASAVFAPLNLEALDANEYLDSGVDAASPAGTWASGARYRLIAINGLGEEYALGEARVAPALASGDALTTYPNPAPDGRVNIAYQVPFDAITGGAASSDVEVAIYDASGRRVRQIASGVLASGVRMAAWDGRSDAGEPVAAGVYFARLSWGGVPRATERVTVIR